MMQIGKKKYTDKEARSILLKLRENKNACNKKLKKIDLRIGLLEKFIDETKGKKVTLSQWLKSKGIDCKKVFSSLGYYTPKGQAVSNDSENKYLKYSDDMIYNPEIKGYVPNVNYVDDKNHNIITKSQLGMTFDPALQLYFPTTIYDTELYASAEGNGEEVIDIVGFFSPEDIGKFSAFNDDSETIIRNVIEIYGDEYDNVEGELDNIYEIENQIEQYSNADSKAGRNATCRAGCDLKHIGNKRKREDCKKECDSKFPPSTKQQERREDRDERKEARQEKRKGIKDCKDKLRAGELTQQQFKECRKAEKKEKRERIKQSGGSWFARVGRGVAKVFPLTLASRGGVLILTEMNAFGFATRLAPALLPESEAKTKFKPEAINNGKKAWEKISNAFRNLGGNPDKLKEKVLKGYKKKASKVEKQASSDGSNYLRITVPAYSNIEPATAALITAGIGALVSLVDILTKNKVPKDPYLEGQAPPEWDESKNATDELPEVDPNSPVLDPKTGEWIDPSTGKRIDPLTGTFKDEIFGMNKWLFYGLLGAVGIGTILLIRKRMVK